MMLVANIFKFTALRNAAASKSVFKQLSASTARQKKHNNELNQKRLSLVNK